MWSSIYDVGSSIHNGTLESCISSSIHDFVSWKLNFLYDGTKKVMSNFRIFLLKKNLQKPFNYYSLKVIKFHGNMSARAGRACLGLNYKLKSLMGEA